MGSGAARSEKRVILGISIKTIKDNIVSRLPRNWILKYTDDEIRDVFYLGKDLDLPHREIEDIILNGCRPDRPDKVFSASDLASQCQFWKVVKNRGYPNLFTSLADYDRFSTVVKNLAQEWNLPNTSIFVQGSSLRISNVADIGDLDVAIKVDAATFDNLVIRFRSIANDPTLIAKIGEKGIIKGVDMKRGNNVQGSLIGDFYPRFETAFGQTFQSKLNVPKIQISVISENSVFNISPFLKLR